MTYERPETLVKTIKLVQNQIFPPNMVLIIDNSESHDTSILLEKQKFKNIRYHRVGYNSGPAGAAKIGLQMLTNLGYNWIYWGDDDNPPRDHFVFQQMFMGIQFLIGKNIQIGIMGGKGGRFNPLTGKIKSLNNAQLKVSKYVEADSVPGGHTMIVNTEIIKSGIFPNAKYFFGFEEFDFCIRAKKNNFKIYIDSQSWLSVRYKAKLNEDNYRWKAASFGNLDNLSREYYSTRNLLEIFFKNKFYLSFLVLLVKSLLKIPASFKFGYKYGFNMSKIQIAAIAAFFLNKFGKRI